MKAIIDFLMKRPLVYKLVQAILAGEGHKVIKSYLKKNIPKSAKKILDQGCGTGEYSLLFGDKYTGLDIDKGYIEDAKRRYLGNFIVGSATKMKLKDNSYDCVFSVGLYHHLNDGKAKKAVLEALRVTKENGMVIIVDAMLPKNIFNLMGFFLRKIDRGRFVRRYDKTLEFIPTGLRYNYEILSSFPFDYIAIEVIKKNIKFQ